MVQQVKNIPVVQKIQEMQVQYLRQDDPLEEEMATSISRKSHGQRSLVGYSPRGLKESDMTEQVNTKASHCW